MVLDKKPLKYIVEYNGDNIGEVITWLDFHMDGDFLRVYCGHGENLVHFELEEDAIAFKLKWVQ